jgi:signal transduction histidine kinase
MLDVTRITSGRMSIAQRRVDLSECARAVVARSTELLARARCTLQLSAERPVIGFWDPIAMETVLSNLLSNATKFGVGQPIEITIQQDGPLARVVVRDHGIGIASEEQTRIFQRFERAVPTRHYGGFGIGLWAARQIIEAHGGTVQVVSEPRCGSTFTVELPTGLGGAAIDTQGVDGAAGKAIDAAGGSDLGPAPAIGPASAHLMTGGDEP